MKFTITRLISDENGDSQFKDTAIELKESGDIGWLSEILPVTGLIFRTVAPDYDYQWHNAPARQLIILLEGSIEIETSTGVRRSFHGGDVILVEDATGKGHRTKNLTTTARRSIFVHLEENIVIQ